MSALITSFLLIVALMPAMVKAQTTLPPIMANTIVANPPPVIPPNPFNLAHLAYEGYLKDEGIPNAAALLDALASGAITVQDILQAALKANLIPSQTFSDQRYRNNLEDQLKGLSDI
jgi:hypothetical protein